MSETLADDYGLSKIAAAAEVPAPALDYRPRDPRAYRPAIGVIGCGGISAQHLNAYRHAGYHVAALCDRHVERARARRDEFFPEARVSADYRELLTRPEIEVVDLATHPADRVPVIEAAIDAGKHVLSQKPFALDLDVGARWVERAARAGVKLAVNQNGRWAPHFGYIREAIRAGLIGEVVTADFAVHWDHGWVVGTPFEEMEHLVLSDFAIHWFDLAACFFGARAARRVYAAVGRAPGQRARPPMLARAVIEFDGGQAALGFNATVVHGQEDRTLVAGTAGTIASVGPSLSEQHVTLSTAEGYARPRLEGTWFREGFHGAMGELLCAIEEGREPSNGARENLRGLALVFAAIESAREGRPKEMARG